MKRRNTESTFSKRRNVRSRTSIHVPKQPKVRIDKITDLPVELRLTILEYAALKSPQDLVRLASSGRALYEVFKTHENLLCRKSLSRLIDEPMLRWALTFASLFREIEELAWKDASANLTQAYLRNVMRRNADEERGRRLPVTSRITGLAITVHDIVRTAAINDLIHRGAETDDSDDSEDQDSDGVLGSMRNQYLCLLNNFIVLSSDCSGSMQPSDPLCRLACAFLGLRKQPADVGIFYDIADYLHWFQPTNPSIKADIRDLDRETQEQLEKCIKESVSCSMLLRYALNRYTIRDLNYIDAVVDTFFDEMQGKGEFDPKTDTESEEEYLGDAAFASGRDKAHSEKVFGASGFVSGDELDSESSSEVEEFY